jgi:hypothetical protein
LLAAAVPLRAFLYFLSENLSATLLAARFLAGSVRSGVPPRHSYCRYSEEQTMLYNVFLFFFFFCCYFSTKAIGIAKGFVTASSSAEPPRKE